MRGRKPKPSTVHALTGTFNATRHKARLTEPQPPDDLNREPPAWLSDAQQALWRHAIENAPAHLLKSIDTHTLAVYVEAVDRHQRAAMAQARLDENNAEPLMYRDGRGNLAPSPYLHELYKAGLIIMKAGAEMGFSPASRPRLASVPKPDTDASPWAALAVIDGGKAG